MYWPGVVWAVSAVTYLLGGGKRAASLYDDVAPVAGQLLVDPAGIFLGCTDHHVGLLAAASGIASDVRRHLCDAKGIYERIGATWWTAQVGSTIAQLSRPSTRPSPRT
jgi:hypothetical protein